MARHLKPADGRTRAMRATALVLVWVGGLVVGFFGILSVGARYGCSHSATGLACRTSGSTLGIVVVVLVIAVVTAVTVGTHGREPRAIAVATVLGAVGLSACYVCAHALLATA
ncbi:MAG: hypothetical protein QOE97_789 [Pseudonocardiales bacterium]|jgi:hypothetical protein|nr:hypothetical protein [Pseudonocardiales bacterium]